MRHGLWLLLAGLLGACTGAPELVPSPMASVVSSAVDSAVSSAVDSAVSSAVSSAVGEASSPTTVIPLRDLSPVALEDLSDRSVLLLEGQDAVGAPIVGCGFFVGPDWIIANHHVVRGMVQGTAQVVDGQEAFPIEGVLASDEVHDLVLLKLKGSHGRIMPLGRGEEVALGDPVYSLGQRRGMGDSLVYGLVSSIRTEGGSSILKTTSPTAGGSSGGPVVNARGEVVGVTTFTIPNSLNLSYPQPVAHVEALMASAGELRSLRDFSPTTVPLAAPKFQVETAPGFALRHSDGWVLLPPSATSTALLTLHSVESSALVVVYRSLGEVPIAKAVANYEKAGGPYHSATTNDTVGGLVAGSVLKVGLLRGLDHFGKNYHVNHDGHSYRIYTDLLMDEGGRARALEINAMLASCRWL